MPRIKQIVVPTIVHRTRKVRNIGGRKGSHYRKLPVTLEEGLSDVRPPPPAPTLLFKRITHRGKGQRMWIVPPLPVPVYWFDRMMLEQGWITAVPPDVFLAAGHRFRVLAQRNHTFGRWGLTRWLVYDEGKVPEGEQV